MKFIEVFTKHDKRILINTDNLLSITEASTEDQLDYGIYSEILLSNNGIIKVKNSYEDLKNELLEIVVIDS